jgi:hypothetical protein
MLDTLKSLLKVRIFKSRVPVPLPETRDGLIELLNDVAKGRSVDTVLGLRLVSNDLLVWMTEEEALEEILKFLDDGMPPARGLKAAQAGSWFRNGWQRRLEGEWTQAEIAFLYRIRVALHKLEIRSTAEVAE